MSRQRFIYPDIWTSEQFLALSIPARLLFVGIFSTADDYGRRTASPVSLKAAIFPADDIRKDDVLQLRNEIIRQKLIRLYADEDGIEILDIPSWTKFQKPRHLSDSRLPEYPGEGVIDIPPANRRHDDGKTPSSAGDPPTGDGEMPLADGSGGVKGVVVKSGSTSPPCNHQLPGTDLQAETYGSVAAGMVFGWKKRHDNFKAWSTLGHKVFRMNQVDPVTLLAHVVEIDKSKRIKSKPAAMLRRLATPRSGTKRRVPADKWFAKAKEILNGSPADRKKSEPEQLGDILKGGK